MLLCIDIGNTNTVLGVDHHNELASHWRVSTDHEKMPDEHAMLILELLRHAGIHPSDISGIALASVVPPVTGAFEELCRRYFGQEPLVVGAGIRTGVRIRYDNPREVGADRVVNAAAVHKLHGGPACVVDFGTATTFDAISEEGDYVGGAIAPGVIVSAEALFQRTAKLPRIDLVPPGRAIGTNTMQSMQSGVLYGYVGLVEGMISRFRKELGPGMKVVATGGLASLIADQSAELSIVDPWLTLKGLRIIWDLNR